jgi:hypothetical protein
MMICYQRKPKKITTLALLSKSYRHYYRESRMKDGFSKKNGEIRCFRADGMLNGIHLFHAIIGYFEHDSAKKLS